LASPDSVRYRFGKFVRRHRVGVVAAAAIVTAVAAGITATVWQARVAERERTHAQREFDAVRGLAQAMLLEVTPAVGKLPGSTAVREIIIRRGTEYLDALASEASHDDELRREVALGYVRLSEVQGSIGLPNIGDRDAAKRSLLKAVSMMDPLVRRPTAMVGDRLRLATTLAQLSFFESDAQANADLNGARALLDTLSLPERSTPQALAARESLWSNVADRQIRRRDFEGARASQQEFLNAAQEQFRRAPSTEFDASRNLSLAYKYLGGTLEMLNRRPESLALYAKALDLDQRRVAEDPKAPVWRLDLSFSYGAIGAALQAQHDFEGARAQYEKAVALREAVVREDPNEDFAKAALGRGYDRLASIGAQAGHPTVALEYSAKGRQTYRDRLQAHPERDNVWREFAEAALDDIDGLLVLASNTSRAARRPVVVRVDALLDELQENQEQWTRGKHAGELPPSAAQLSAARARVASLR
ncbi:MAG: hypothetical protein ACRD1V_02735, partial [Vicinamibacterales bacterium]